MVVKTTYLMQLFHFLTSGEHQMELLDFVAAKFHEEGGVFKLLVGKHRKITSPGALKWRQRPHILHLLVVRSSTPSWPCSEWTFLVGGSWLSGSRNWPRCSPGCRRSPKVLQPAAVTVVPVSQLTSPRPCPFRVQRCSVYHQPDDSWSWGGDDVRTHSFLSDRCRQCWWTRLMRSETIRWFILLFYSS